MPFPQKREPCKFIVLWTHLSRAGDGLFEFCNGLKRQ